MDDDVKRGNGYGHVLKYTGLFGGVQGLNIIIGLVRNKAVAVLLGPAGMGLASLLGTVATFVTQATGLGISFSAIRHLSEIFDGGDDAATARFVASVRAWSLVAALIGAAACLVGAGVLAVAVLGDGSRAADIAALAPTVALTALAGGETAILKGARRLRELAWAQVAMVAAALAVAVPIYWAAGMAGIIPVMTLSAAANLWLTARRSLRLYPLRRGQWAGALGRGRGMVALGVAFVAAGIVGSGAELAVRSYLNATADLDSVGLYNAGYMMAVTYAGMVLSAMDADFFPRLSAINGDPEAVNITVNRQAEVSLLVAAPMLTLLITALPVLVPLLFSGKFAGAVPMAQAASVAMYFKVASTPMEYIALAKGHSVAFMKVELAFNVLFAVSVIVGFSRWGLLGAGAALVAAYIANLLIVYLYVRRRYDFRASRRLTAILAVQLPIGFAACAVALTMHSWQGVAIGAALTLASTAVAGYTFFSSYRS